MYYSDSLSTFLFSLSGHMVYTDIESNTPQPVTFLEAVSRLKTKQRIVYVFPLNDKKIRLDFSPRYSSLYESLKWELENRGIPCKEFEVTCILTGIVRKYPGILDNSSFYLEKIRSPVSKIPGPGRQ
jgi:hypothetical protein